MKVNTKAVRSPDSQIEIASSGHVFTEGPVWRSNSRTLIFSDITANTMYALLTDGQVREYRRPSNFANGSTLDNEGRLVTCEHGSNSVVREEDDGQLTILASQWHGVQLNSPNDVIVDRSGTIWFTDPTYGRMERFGNERPQDLAFQGVYRLSIDGELVLVADDFAQPNGLCLTRDGKTLLVSDTSRFHIRKFSIANDGSVIDAGIFAETRGHGPGCPDGLKIDSADRVFSCGPGGLQVFGPGGELIEILAFPEVPANFTWGGVDLRTLFVTAETSVYQLQVLIPGHSPN